MKFLPAGPSALLVELGGLDEVLAVTAEIDRRRRSGWGEGLTDVVPGATTVLLDGVASPLDLARELEDWRVVPVPAAEATTVELRCRYGGPDLAAVARHWGVTEEGVVALHTSLTHRVAFCGFAPGFAYIAGLGERYAVPRLPAPRPSVPPGSVGLAATYTGIYPRSTPGGWQLIGRTDDVVWDPDRRPPALLAPGTTVRFVPV
jgi:KipI family sensor histidine kinase inhibitor